MPRSINQNRLLSIKIIEIAGLLLLEFQEAIGFHPISVQENPVESSLRRFNVDIYPPCSITMEDNCEVTLK